MPLYVIPGITPASLDNTVSSGQAVLALHPDSMAFVSESGPLSHHFRSLPRELEDEYNESVDQVYVSCGGPSQNHHVEDQVAAVHMGMNRPGRELVRMRDSECGCDPPPRLVRDTGTVPMADGT